MDDLYNEISNLKHVVDDLSQMVNQLVKIVADEQSKRIDLNNKFYVQNAVVDNMKYELNDPENEKCDFFYPTFRSDEETIRLIVEEGKSLGRFGDGEFSIAFDIEKHAFQKTDERLKQRIWQVLHSSNDNYIIGIARNYGLLDRYTTSAADGIRLYMTEDVRKMHRAILPPDIVYTDAYISRPYVMHADNKTDAPLKRFEALKTIWEKKNVIMVEGAKTRLGVGNDLFDNAKSIKRIIAPAVNSFDRYDDILESCIRYGKECDLFLIAIGPSAGVLAYDLSENGLQGIDIGHLDLEYEWFLAGEGRRTKVAHKYNNEINGGRDEVIDIEDEVYQSQILCECI